MSPNIRFHSSHVALVTGASSGIGAATAIQFGKDGSHVAVHYCSNREGADLIVEGVREIGVEAAAFQADLSNPEEAAHLTEEVLGRWGHIDALINNAGSLIDRRLLDEITPEYWQQVIDVNYSSVLWMTQKVAPSMRKRGKGAIVNLSSIAARNGGSPGALAYASAKAAVLCMTKGLARELIADGIRVNSVSPGVIATPFHDRFTPEDRMKAIVSMIPQGRSGIAEEIAQVIAFLASGEASHIVGETIEVNGGLLMD